MKNEGKVSLFLDSGAFSAFTKNITIDIQEYISFIKEHEDCLEVYANLDVIGDAEATWQNQKIMEDSGLHPLPVFHQGGPEKYLERYLAKYPYVALGGMVGTSSTSLTPWLDRVFSTLICDSAGIPKVKIHGFGLTSLKLMLRYPWYSVDSTSWVVTGRMGGIFIPRYRAGKWLYDENSWKIAVSNRSPSTKDAGRHITTLLPREKEVLLHYIHSKGYELGKSSFRKESQSYELKENERWAEKKPKESDALREVETIEVPGLSNKYQLRDEMNIIYFLDLEKALPEWPWPFKLSGVGGLGI